MLRLALAAVIEDAGGELSYWALRARRPASRTSTTPMASRSSCRAP